MIKLNKDNIEKLNRIKSRLEQERILCIHCDLEKYVSDYIVEGMEKWQENDYLIQHLTETQLELLVGYDTEKCLMKDIIDFVIFQTENEFKVYPLVLDTFIVYDMIVDFAEENDMIYVECLNCGALQYVKRTEIQKDDKGEYVTCYQCNATFDIDNVKKGE